METPVTLRTASLEVRRPSLPGGWILFLGPIIIPIVSGVLIWLEWDAIPEKFPIHWGLDGQPNRWMAKTFAGVFGVTFSGVAISVLLLWMGYYIYFRTRQVSTDPAGIQGERARKTFAFVSVLTIAYVMAFVNAWIILRPLWATPSERPVVGVIILPIVVTVVIILYAVRLANSGPVVPGDGTPDACWKWGLIYYNPDDPALIVEKRIGIGWTINLGNKWSWCFSILILSIPLILLAINRLVVGE